MSIAIITGSAGLVGSEAARFLHAQGMSIAGVDNHLRGHFFGPDSSTEWNTELLRRDLPNYRHEEIDIRDREGIDKLFARYGTAISLIVHTAGQPSHDWAARDPLTDFSVNATGTLILLEAARRRSPDAVFIFTSTNKVYGDAPNRLPLVELETRWELDPTHPYAEHGIDEELSVDQCMHSVFGASKLGADVMTQEYGRYFGLKTAVFRAGCITGPAHSGAELHGFLSYLVKRAITGRPYQIHGYRGKQVRDNIHAHDLASAFWHFYQAPRPGAVYNIGGSRHSNCSVLEAIRDVEELSGRRLQWTLSDQARGGDHIWWVSDVRRFQRDYPGWAYRYGQKAIIAELIEATLSRARA
jgi:CDP-paratose 2-epimerase